MGVDVEAARAAMLTPGLRAAARSGASKYANGQARFVLKHNAVITTLER